MTLATPGQIVVFFTYIHTYLLYTYLLSPFIYLSNVKDAHDFSNFWSNCYLCFSCTLDNPINLPTHLSICLLCRFVRVAMMGIHCCLPDAGESVGVCVNICVCFL